MKIKVRLVVAVVAMCVASCTTSNQKLDITSYLSLAREGVIYPSQEQMAMLEDLIPDHNYAPFPAIEDRTYWDAIAASTAGQEYLAQSLEMLPREPEVPISDEIYYRANLEGLRGIYKPRYYRTMERLEHFLLAECIENQGRFIDQIERYIEAIISMKSWLHPNHDDAQNSVMEGRRMAIDLGARKFGFVLSLCQTTLTDKLPSQLQEKILFEVKRRISDSYIASCKGEDNVGNQWIYGTSNWNSVCTSGSVLAILATSKSKEERVAAVGSAINSMDYYLSGFSQDGYCSEGLGYWEYGFGHYMQLADMLYNYSDGKIDLFEFNNPEKMVAIANFPKNYEIHGGFYAPFADGVTAVADGSENFGYLMAAMSYGARKPSYLNASESIYTVIGWRDGGEHIEQNTAEELAGVTFFEQFGAVISRGDQQNKFSVAIKAGNNGENHNHDDVGSYFVLLGDDIVAGDIGAPSYVAGAFDVNNPARCSWGHPVPRINNTLQSNGKEFAGRIVDTQFEATKDVATLDLMGAYQVPELKSLERTMINEKNAEGKITIIDKFEATEAVDFGTAITINVDYVIDGNIVILNTGNHKVKVVVTSTGGEVVLNDEVVPVEKLRSGRRSYRIGVEFTEPLSAGSIEVAYMPI